MNKRPNYKKYLRCKKYYFNNKPIFEPEKTNREAEFWNQEKLDLLYKYSFDDGLEIKDIADIFKMTYTEIHEAVHKHFFKK